MSILKKNILVAILFLLLSFKINIDFCIEGKVKKIDHGKDGFEATLQGNDRKTYIAVASMVDMGTHEFKMLSIGDSVKICGTDTFRINGTLHILAQHITIEK